MALSIVVLRFAIFVLSSGSSGSAQDTGNLARCTIVGAMGLLRHFCCSRVACLGNAFVNVMMPFGPTRVHMIVCV